MKTGFYKINTPWSQQMESEWWILPYSGRAMEIVSLAQYSPLEESEVHWIRIYYNGDDDAFLSQLFGHLNPFEHDIIQIILDNE